MSMSLYFMPVRIGFFRGVPFRLGSYDFSGGRRHQHHEYPLRDEPKAEDLGRRGYKFQFQAHVIGDTWELQRDLLVAALNLGGPGTLVHPYLGEHQVLVDTFTVHEGDARRRIAQFSMSFVEDTPDWLYPTAPTNPDRALGSSLTEAWDA